MSLCNRYLEMDHLRMHYRQMARRCGYWATARHMRKLGFSLEQTAQVLFGRVAKKPFVDRVLDQMLEDLI